MRANTQHTGALEVDGTKVSATWDLSGEVTAGTAPTRTWDCPMGYPGDPAEGEVDSATLLEWEPLEEDTPRSVQRLLDGLVGREALRILEEDSEALEAAVDALLASDPEE